MSLQSIVDASFLESQIRWLVGVVAQNTLTLGGPLSLASLSLAFMIACIVTVYKRRAKRPNVRPKALVRVLLPGKMFLSRSARADYGFAVFNLLVSGLMLAWAILSLGEVSRVTAGVLTFVAGTRESSGISPITASILITVALFLAFELGYWINHWLSHTVPFMWQFHRVHHEAEVLTPVTNLRVHPVASFFYYNIVALSTGLAHGTLHYLFGTPMTEITVSDVNVISLVLFSHIGHLHHSHVWLPFTGLLGRILISPAHHQIHHSADPAHYNRNYGANIAIFDWMAGTLHVPSKSPEKLTFGVARDEYDPHTAVGGMLAPMVRAARLFAPEATADRPREAVQSVPDPRA